MKSGKILAFAIGPIAAAVFGAFSLPIVTWFYSPEDVGRISMLQLVMSMSVLLSTLGLDQAYVREYHECQNKAVLLKTALTPGIFVLLASAMCLLVWPNILSVALFSINSCAISILVALCILAAFASRFLSLILRMQERGLAFSMSQILPKMLFMAIIGFYVLFSFGFDLTHLVAANTSSIVMVTLVYGWNTRKDLLMAVGQSVDRQLLKRMFSFGFPLVFGGLSSWGLISMGRLALRHFSTYDQLGIYSVAISFAGAAIVFQTIFSTIWAPTVYKWAAAGDLQNVEKVSETVLLVVVLLFALTGTFSWIISYLLPPRYASVQYLVVSCMCYPLFYTLSEATGVGLGITRRSTLSMLASIIAALVNLISCYLFVPGYGAAGAGVSTALAFWVFFFCRTEFSIRSWRPIPRRKLYISTLICLLLSVSFTILGVKQHAFFMVLWLLLLVGITFLLRRPATAFAKQLFAGRAFAEEGSYHTEMVDPSGEEETSVTPVNLFIFAAHHASENIAAQRFKALTMFLDPAIYQIHILTKSVPATGERVTSPAPNIFVHEIDGQFIGKPVSPLVILIVIISTFFAKLPFLVGPLSKGINFSSCWMLNALNAAESIFRTSAAHSEKSFVIGTYSPIDALIATRCFALRFSLPNMSDFRDGFVFESHGRKGWFASKSRSIIEGHIVRTATLITSVSCALVSDFKKRYPRTQVELLPNGYNPEEFEFLNNGALSAEARTVIKNFPEGKTILGHFGRVSASDYTSIKSLYKFHNFFQNDDSVSESVHLLFAGELTSEEEGLLRSLPCSMSILPMIPRTLAHELMSACDILLLFTGDRTSCATGKLYEYLATNRKVFCLSVVTNEASRILKETHAGKTVLVDDRDGASVLKQEVTNAKNDTMAHRKGVTVYSRKKQAATLSKWIQRSCL